VFFSVGGGYFVLPLPSSLVFLFVTPGCLPSYWRSCPRPFYLRLPSSPSNWVLWRAASIRGPLVSFRTRGAFGLRVFSFPVSFFCGPLTPLRLLLSADTTRFSMGNRAPFVPFLSNAKSPPSLVYFFLHRQLEFHLVFSQDAPLCLFLPADAYPFP